MFKQKRIGRSILFRKLIKNFRTIPNGIIISSEDNNNKEKDKYKYFLEFFPKEIIYDVYEKDKIDKIINKQNQT